MTEQEREAWMDRVDRVYRGCVVAVAVIGLAFLLAACIAA